MTTNMNGDGDWIFAQLTRGKLPKLRSAKWQELSADTYLFGYKYAKGSQYKVFETKDAGWVAFAPGTKTPEGHTPGRLYHRY